MFKPARYLITTVDKVNIIWIHSKEQLNVLCALKHQHLISNFERIEVKHNG